MMIDMPRCERRTRSLALVLVGLLVAGLAIVVAVDTLGTRTYEGAARDVVLSQGDGHDRVDLVLEVPVATEGLPTFREIRMVLSERTPVVHDGVALTSGSQDVISVLEGSRLRLRAKPSFAKHRVVSAIVLSEFGGLPRPTAHEMQRLPNEADVTLSGVPHVVVAGESTLILVRLDSPRGLSVWGVADRKTDFGGLGGPQSGKKTLVIARPRSGWVLVDSMVPAE